MLNSLTHTVVTMKTGFCFVRRSDGEELFLPLSCIEGIRELPRDIDLTGMQIQDVTIGVPNAPSKKRPITHCTLIPLSSWARDYNRCTVYLVKRIGHKIIESRAFILDGTLNGAFFTVKRPLLDEKVLQVLQLGCPDGLIQEIKDLIRRW